MTLLKRDVPEKYIDRTYVKTTSGKQINVNMNRCKTTKSTELYMSKEENVNKDRSEKDKSEKEQTWKGKL